ncbi:ketopantoate reductase [Lasiosphaeria miniovina]|uniref:Ketopantoate reductase n=1 Tax=Lasiosphaeria miniovina TaxID=1954250 RepID=A0AA40A069_9PEZI|nr:ketopantoate reductase [Lasiosphaeria miniovina]KAK0706883.1 ketopantoate reductase [Lasiosphaeria miniovina]
MFSPARRLNHSLPRTKNMLGVCVVGAGGVGTIAAYVLENSQRARVTAILRSNYALVKERGFGIDSIDHGKVTNWRPHNVLKPLVTPGKTSLALVQNGLAIEAPFAAAFPNTPTFSSVSMIGSRLTNSTSIFHQYPDVSKIGAHFHHVDDTFTRATQHDVAALYVDVYNAGLAGAKPKTNARCLLVEDILLSGPGRNTLLEPAMREVAAVATAASYGDAVSEDMIQNMLHDSAPTSTFRPSMLVNLENERPLELEVILGAPLRAAKEKGVCTPILTQVYELLNQAQWKLTQEVGK